MLLFLKEIKTYPLNLWISLFIRLENQYKCGISGRLATPWSIFNLKINSLKSIRYKTHVISDRFLYRKATQQQLHVHNHTLEQRLGLTEIRLWGRPVSAHPSSDCR